MGAEVVLVYEGVVFAGVDLHGVGFHGPSRQSEDTVGVVAIKSSRGLLRFKVGKSTEGGEGVWHFMSRDVGHQSAGVASRRARSPVFLVLLLQLCDG